MEYLSTKMKTPARRPRQSPHANSLKLWVVLSRASAAIARHVEADVARHGLTGTEFGILEALHHKGPLLLGDIQAKILVTSGGITYLVDRLVKKGLVRRVQSPDDRRARFAVLTPAGSALIRRIFPEHAGAIAEAVAGLSARERTTATRLLKKLGLAASRRVRNQ